MIDQMLGKAGATMKDFFAKETWAIGGGIAIGDKIIAPFAAHGISEYIDPEKKITGWSRVGLNGVIKVGIGSLLWLAAMVISPKPLKVGDPIQRKFLGLFVRFMGIGSMVSWLGDVMVQLYPPIAQYEAKGLLAITGRRSAPARQAAAQPLRQPAPRGKVIVRGNPAAAQAPIATAPVADLEQLFSQTGVIH